jgi:hypothetical protein
MKSPTRNFLGDQIDAVVRELSKLAIACDIKLPDPEAAEKILRGDDRVCGRKNPKAFREIQAHLKALLPLRQQAVDEMGARETKEIMDQIRDGVMALRNAGMPADRD